MIGDCQAVVDGRSLDRKQEMDVLSEMRTLILSTLEQERRNTAGLYREEWEEHDALARKLFCPGFLRATIYANDDTTEYGYSVFNGQSYTGKSKSDQLREGAHEVILTSDRYPR